MKIMSWIQSFEQKHGNATLFIGILIGIGVGMYLYGSFVPGMSNNMRSMYRMNRHGDMGQHMMSYRMASPMSSPSITSEKQFLSEMIVHHEMAVRMSHQVLGLTSVSAAVAQLAGDIITAQTVEIDAMKEMAKALK